MVFVSAEGVQVAADRACDVSFHGVQKRVSVPDAT